MRKLSFFSKLFVTAILVFFASFGVNAQVTIGSSNPPSPFSLLDLDAGQQQRALHNARLTTSQRDALVSPDSVPSVQGLAVGLLLFNTDNNCLEFWNGTQWVSLCDGQTPDPCAGFGTMNAVFCSPATIDSLTQRAIAAGGNGSVQWFASASGGTALAPTTALTDGVEYWADNCAGALARVPVLVSLVDCSNPPTAGFVTAWTNAMYDFQSQTLSIVVSGGDNATSWQWQVSSDGGVSWSDISGATQPTFTIPANFVYTNGFMVEGAVGQNPASVDFNTRGLYFRVSRINPAGGSVTAGFNMLFIRTNTSGFTTDVNGVVGLAMNRGGGGTTRFALLNVGATNDNSLGDLYQWGRMSDGHQTIGWAKNPSTGANIFDTSPLANVASPVTSSVVARNADMNVMGVDDTVGGQVTNSPFVGRFITNAGDWGTQDTPSNQRWGLGTDFVTRATAPTSITQWAFPSNNPCPTGWRVPNRFELWDINNGNGINNPVATSWNISTASGNTWIWRSAQNGAAGGAIITNQNGEVLFLPAVGWRINTSAPLSNAGGTGVYWSSTFSGMLNGIDLRFTNDFVNAGFNTPSRAFGNSVRCVAE